MTSEEAFRYEPEFKGRKLQPFSFLRQTAAMALGLSYGRITERDFFPIDNPRKERSRELAAKPDRTVDEDSELYEIDSEPEQVQMYNGLLRDCAIVMWLCAAPDKEVQRARRKPEEYESKIDAFADAEEITLTGLAFQEAATAFFGIMAAISASRPEPIPPKGEKGGDNTPLL